MCDMAFRSAERNIGVRELKARNDFRSGTTSSALDVSSPCIAGFGGVLLGDLVAVAEHLSDQGSRETNVDWRVPWQPHRKEVA